MNAKQTNLLWIIDKRSLINLKNMQNLLRYIAALIHSDIYFFHIKTISLLCLISLPIFDLLSQTQQAIYIRGKVIDSDTEEAIPFANIYLQNHAEIGTNSDLKGDFKIEYVGSLPSDTLIISVVGYETFRYYINRNKKKHNIRAYMLSKIQSLDEVQVLAGENPANILVRNAARFKKRYNKNNTSAYEFRTYNHVELYVNNIRGLKNSKAFKDIKNWAVKDGKEELLKDRRGNSVIPFYFVETISNFYVRKKPYAKKEEIIRRKSKGIGVNDDDGITKLMTGKGFSDYNFYENQVLISDKYITSPIADGWNVNYKFWLIDSVVIEGQFCYKLEVEPRKKEEIVFEGFIWIAKEDYALKKLDLVVSENAQMNFVKSLKIEQTLAKTEKGIYMPSVTHLEIDIEGLIEQFPGIYMKLHTYNDQFETNKPKPVKFFNTSISYDKMQTNNDDSQWRFFRERRVALGDSAIFQAYQMVDSVEQLPSVKRTAKLMRILANGYMETKKIDYGHWLGLYSNNDVEGSRIGAGFKTSTNLSKKFLFKGYAAYGLRDKQFKYKGQFFYWPETYRPTLIGLQFKDDIDPVSIIGQTTFTSFLYDYLSRWGNYTRWNPLKNQEMKAWIEKEVLTGLKTFFTLRHIRYSSIPGTLGAEFNTPDITTSEFEVGIQYAKNIRALRTRGNNIIYLGPQKAPILTLRGVFGFKNIFGSDYNYQKIFLDLYQRRKEILGMGSATITFYAGYVFNNLPYPLLKSHQGNNSIFIFQNSSEGMNSFEFVSDYFAELHFTHFFQGFLINRIPLLKYLNKWVDARLMLAANVVWGGLSNGNQLLTPQSEVANVNPLFYNLDPKTPYVDIGFGIENIFKIFRINLFRRLTYLSNQNVDDWRIKISTRLQLF